MNFDEYQQKAKKYDSFEATNDLREVGFIAKILGLAGESGEATDKIKKILRDKDGVMDDEDKLGLKKELGDVLWYLATIARYLEIPLSEIAELNLTKLEDRYQRNKIHGAGDNR